VAAVRLCGGAAAVFNHETGRCIMEKNKKLRIAMIGCGSIARIHLEAYKQIPEAEIVAGCDVSEANLEWIEKSGRIPGSRLFTDWRQMLAGIKPDAADICTPNFLHCAATIDACDAGCHVLLEKPMAMTVAEGERMIEATERSHVRFSVDYQQRFNPQTEFFIRAREAGDIGDILFMKCQVLHRRGIPNWGNFVQKSRQGGGPLMDIGSHAIDLGMYVMGSPAPVRIAGKTWLYIGNRPSEVASMWPNWDYKNCDVEDLAVGHVEFANGAVMQIEASTAAHIKEDVFKLTFMGTKGGGTWYSNWHPDKMPELYTDHAGTMVNIVPGWLPSASRDDMFVAKIRDWVNACLYDTPLRSPASDALKVQKIINGIYDQSNCTVSDSEKSSLENMK